MKIYYAIEEYITVDDKMTVEQKEIKGVKGEV